MSSSSRKQVSLMTALLPLVVLYVATVVLVALTRENGAGTTNYWEFFVPVVAFISLIMGWGTAYAAGRSRSVYLFKQVLQWGALIGLLWVLQNHGLAAALGDQKYTLVMLYLLALTTLFVGLNQDSKMFFYGLFLAFCTYLLTAPANLALLTPIGARFNIADAQNKPLTMIIALAIVAFLVSAFLLISTRGTIAAKRARG